MRRFPESGMSPVPHVRRIAVLRASALGDLVFALPALEALRATYPDAEIILIGRRLHSELLGSRTSPVNSIIALDAPPQRRPPEGILSTLTEGEPLDLAVQLHGGGRESNPFVRALGARLTVGARSADAEPLDRAIPYRFYQPEVFRALEIVGLAGAEPVGYRPRLAVTGEDVRAASAVVDRVGPTVVLHPGASDLRRRWPADRFARVGDELAGCGYTVAVTGTGSEGAVVRDVVARMRHPAVDLADRLSISGLVGLLATADLVVSNDTGPLHLAAAVGAPTVGLFWIGNLITGGPSDRARNRPLIAWEARCPRCGADATETRGCDHRDSFVESIATERVIEEALDLLARETGRSALPLEDRPGALGVVDDERERRPVAPAAEEQMPQHVDAGIRQCP